MPDEADPSPTPDPADAERPLVGPIDVAYFKAAKQWDRMRREAERREVNDPVKNRKLYNALLRQAIDLHGPLPVPREKDLRAHERLAYILQLRPADRRDG